MMALLGINFFIKVVFNKPVLYIQMLKYNHEKLY